MSSVKVAQRVVSWAERWKSILMGWERVELGEVGLRAISFSLYRGEVVVVLLLGLVPVRLPGGERREVMKADDSPRDWAAMYWAVMDLRKERVHCELVVAEVAWAEERRGRAVERIARKPVGRVGRTMMTVLVG